MAKSPALLFVLAGCVALICCSQPKGGYFVMTVNGKIDPEQMGRTLSHEHIVTDFIGAEKTAQPQYRQTDAVELILPHLLALKENGVATLVECTPNYIGRDVRLLKTLSELSGIQIVTNTGYYAAVDKKYLPAHIYSESMETIAQRWFKEWHEGIEGSGIRPGFIKLGVDKGALDSLEIKLLRAAIRVSNETGMTIAVHSGDGAAARHEYEILIKEGGKAHKMIWVHAQNGTDEDRLFLARKGVWISLDGVSESRLLEYAAMVQTMQRHHLLPQLLISHDDGWSVEPGDGKVDLVPFNNGNSRPYRTILSKFKESLLQAGVTQRELDQLLVDNPGKALRIGY